jgi:hypothetical protein
MDQSMQMVIVMTALDSSSQSSGPSRPVTGGDLLFFLFLFLFYVLAWLLYSHWTARFKRGTKA